MAGAAPVEARHERARRLGPTRQLGERAMGEGAAAEGQPGEVGRGARRADEPRRAPPHRLKRRERTEGERDRLGASADEQPRRQR
jgi:hypothetical protein